MNNRQHGQVPPSGQQYLAGQYQLPDGAVVSAEELQRLGLTPQQLVQLVQAQGADLAQAYPQQQAPPGLVMLQPQQIFNPGLQQQVVIQQHGGETQVVADQAILAQMAQNASKATNDVAMEAEEMPGAANEGDEEAESPVDEEEGEDEQEEGEGELSDGDDEDAGQRKPRLTLAQVRVDGDIVASESQPLVFSYHYKYEKYLRKNNLIDPKAVRRQEQQQQAPELGGNQPDGEDLSALEEDNSHAIGGGGAGKYRFDTLIKTMIARIEYNNTLAPVQEYGRHMQKAAKKQKKKTEDAGENGPQRAKKDYIDDRFYDLDDDFIDDDNLQEAGGWEGMLAGEGFLGAENSDDDGRSELTGSKMLQYSADADEAREMHREQLQYSKICERFRVLAADQVEALLEQDPTSAIITTNIDEAADGEAKSPNHISAQKVKKRKRDEISGLGTDMQLDQMLGNKMLTPEAQQIQEIVQGLRERILRGENLTHFKRDMAQIAQLVDRADNQEIFEKSVCLLAGVLQKSEREIQLMLKRHCLQDKKKKKKGDLDRRKATVVQLLERELRDANTPVSPDGKKVFFTMADLAPGKFTFQVSPNFRKMMTDLMQFVGEYVETFNEYTKVKTQEEKTKLKKAKAEDQKGMEELDMNTSKRGMVQQIVEQMPPEIRDEVAAHLRVEFGFSALEQEPLINRKLVSQLKDGRMLGGRWNDITQFYDNFQMPVHSAQGLNNPGSVN